MLISFSHCCFIFVSVLSLHTVCLQVPVEGVIGGSVVLPCSSTQHDLKLQDIYVYWTQNGSKSVYDIIKGNGSVVGQDLRYKNRAKTFNTEEYLQGNFSLKLEDLTHADAGKYICYITHSSEYETVELLVKESIEKNGNHGADLVVILVCIFTIVPLIIVFALGYHFRNRLRKIIPCALPSAATTAEQVTEMT